MTSVVDFFKNGMVVSSKESVGAKQWHFTPESIINPMLDNIENISDKTFAVLYNIEITSYLVKRGVNPSNITFYSDCDIRTLAAKALNLEVVNIDDNFEVFENMRKFDVIITNPPYTNGKDGDQFGGNILIYSHILERIYQHCDTLGVICPSSFLSGTKTKKLRDNIFNSSLNLHSIKYLNQLDWGNQIIAISTIVIVFTKEKTIPYIEINNKKIEIDPYSTSSIVSFGENYDFFKKVYSIHTIDKYKISRGELNVLNQYTNIGLKKIGKTLSGKYGGYEVTNTGKFGTNNIEKAKVVFGFSRTEVVVPVEANIGIPGKYVYITSKNYDQANKLADYFMTKLIQLIVYNNRLSKTLNSPQIAFVPVIDLDQFDEINDEVIYKHFNIDSELQKYIEEELTKIKKETKSSNPY